MIKLLQKLFYALSSLIFSVAFLVWLNYGKDLMLSDYFTTGCFSVFLAGFNFYLFEWLSLDDEWRKFNDRNYLANLGWSEQEFNEWMDNERLAMSEEEYKVWSKRYIRWYFNYFSLNKKKVPKK